MYKAIYRNKNTYNIHIKDDKDGWIEYKYQPSGYKLDPNGEFKDIFGKTYKEVNNFKYKDSKIIESDIDPTIKILIDIYYKDDLSPKHNIVYLDIENEIVGTLNETTIQEAKGKITSISLFFNGKYYCLILDKDNLIKQNEKDNKIIFSFNEERDLAIKFIELINEFDTDTIITWNGSYFDIPYIYFRFKQILYEEELNKLSPLGILSINDLRYNDELITIAGLNHFDLMNLHKKYVTKQEPSYKLGDIGLKYVKINKIEFKGNLNTLYKEDIDKFIEYNIRDVEIMVKLEEKLKFIELSIMLCHICHVPYDKIYYATSLSEGAMLTYLKHNNIISRNKPTTLNPMIKDIEIGDNIINNVGGRIIKGEVLYIDSKDKKYKIKTEEGEVKDISFNNTKKDESYAGGYLLEPKAGLYSNVIDLDYTSLYPSIIMSLNLGIETLVFWIKNKDKYNCYLSLQDLKERHPDEKIKICYISPENYLIIEKETTINKIIELVEQKDLIVSASGAFYKKTPKSLSATILESWFEQRKEYKNLMKKAYKVDKNVEMGEFYDRRQHAIKILLNSLYGTYALSGSRFTDGYKVISKSITLTGQRLIKETIEKANNLIQNYETIY